MTLPATFENTETENEEYTNSNSESPISDTLLYDGSFLTVSFSAVLIHEIQIEAQINRRSNC